MHHKLCMCCGFSITLPTVTFHFKNMKKGYIISINLKNKTIAVLTDKGIIIVEYPDVEQSNILCYATISEEKEENDPVMMICVYPHKPKFEMPYKTKTNLKIKKDTFHCEYLNKFNLKQYSQRFLINIIPQFQYYYTINQKKKLNDKKTISYIYSIINNNEIRINAMVNSRKTGLIAIGVDGFDYCAYGIPISMENAKIISKELKLRIKQWHTPEMNSTNAFTRNKIKIRIHPITFKECLMNNNYVIIISILKTTKIKNIMSNNNHYYLTYKKLLNKVSIKNSQ